MGRRISGRKSEEKETKNCVVILQKKKKIV